MWKFVGYYDGKLGPLEEMTVPMGDRALYFGDGIYEATCVVNRIPFAMEDHLDRMYNSLRLMEIPFTMDREEVKAELQKVIDAAEDAPTLFLYWQVSRGVCLRNHPFPGKEVKPVLMAFVKPFSMPSEDRTYKLISLEDVRYKLCNIKTLNLIPSVLANQRAMEQGCDEAVLHRGSRVTECSHSNISILKDGVLRTAPADELILPGITRKHLLQLAREEQLHYRKLEAVYYLMTGNRPCPDRPKTPCIACTNEELRKRYQDEVKGAAHYHALAEKAGSFSSVLHCLGHDEARHSCAVLALLQRCL